VISVKTEFYQDSFSPNLQVGTVGAKTVKLHWVNAAQGETGYRVCMSLNKGTTWKAIADVAADATSYEVTGLIPETTYRFSLRAVHDTLLSARSNEVDVTTKPRG
jgi:hypothetical protein